MKIIYKTNFSGYIVILRAIQFLLKEDKLTFTLLGAYICLICQVDFDKRHKTYRAILRDDSELASEWGCHKTTVYKNRIELINRGLFVVEDGMTKVPNFFIFEIEWVKFFASHPVELIKTLFEKSQSEIENIPKEK